MCVFLQKKYYFCMDKSVLTIHKITQSLSKEQYYQS